MEANIIWYLLPLALLIALAATTGRELLLRSWRRRTHRFGWNHEKALQEYQAAKANPDAWYLPRLRQQVEAEGDDPQPVDLRTIPGYPDVYDQDPFGSCFFNGVSGLIHLLLVRQAPGAFSGLMRAGLIARLVKAFCPSRLYNYFWARKDAGKIEEDCGSSAEPGMKTYMEHGFCHEDPTWPYDPKLFTKEPSLEAQEEGKKNHLEWRWVQQDLVDIRACLREGLGVGFGFVVYGSFYDAQKTGRVPMPRVGHEWPYGGHFVVLVADDPERQVFVFRNSWGNWGPPKFKGHLEIPYKYVLDPKLSAAFLVVTSVAIDD